MLRRILILTIAVAIGLAIGQEAEANWLKGWDKRIRLTIDHNDITSNFSNFPILIHLSNSSGRNSDDVSCVFDELTSNANRKKIAVTKSDGTTQCYVEIEKWDDANEQAWLWVKVSGTNSISSSVDTVLYLYYDKDQTDNTSYVGDSGSTIARNVWDGYFKMVQHLNETDIDGGSGDIKDSTSYVNNGTTKNMNTNDQVPGQIDGSFDFDGTNDYVNLGQPSSLDITGSITISAWIKPDVIFGAIVSKREWISGPWGQYLFDIYQDNLRLVWYNSGSWQGNGSCNITSYISIGKWAHVAGTYNTSTDEAAIYVDGIKRGSVIEPTGLRHYDVSTKIGIWTTTDSNLPRDPFNGRIDEVRISNTARSAAWIKASYERGRDHLLDFGGEEVAGNAIFFGINF